MIQWFFKFLNSTYSPISHWIWTFQTGIRWDTVRLRLSARIWKITVPLILVSSTIRELLIKDPKETPHHYLEIREKLKGHRGHRGLLKGHRCLLKAYLNRIHAGKKLKQGRKSYFNFEFLISRFFINFFETC